MCVFTLYIRTSAGYSLESVQDGSFRFGIQTKTQLGLNHRYWNLESSRTIFWEVILGQNCNILERKSTFRFVILNFWAIDTPMESKNWVNQDLWKVSRPFSTSRVFKS